MKAKYKCALAISITLAMFGSYTTYAASNTSTENKTNVIKEAKVEKKDSKVDLTLQTAIDMIEGNNYDIKLLDKKITVAEKEYKEADDKKGKAYIRNSKNARTSVLDLKKQQEYSWREKLLDLRNARNSREEKLKTLKNEVEKLYLDILIAKDELNFSDSEIKALDDKIEETKAKIKMGLLKENDLKGVELEKTQLISQIANKKSSLEKDIIKLKNYLGLSAETEITLAANNYDIIEIDDKDIEKRISAAIEGSYKLKQKEEELELAKIDCDLKKRYTFVKDEFFIDNLNETVKESELQLEGVKPNMEAELWRSYYDIKALHNKVKIENLNLKDAEASLNEVKIKIAAGTLRKVEENNDMNTLKKQKIKVQKAINDYTIAAHAFETKLEVQEDKEK